MLSICSKGPAVVAAQTKLQALGFYKGKIDGDFGPFTDTAVRDFQTAKHLTVDGMIGPITDAALRSSFSAATNYLQFGVKSGNVGNIQVKLKALGYYTGTIDNDFGPLTDAAVRKFQGVNGLFVDGVVGPLTLKALENVYYAHPNTPNNLPPVFPAQQIQQVPFTNHLDQVPMIDVVNFFGIHHEARPMAGLTPDQYIQRFLEINAEHIARGFACIGYNGVIFPDGTIIQGRPFGKMCAAMYGLNDQSYNFCLVGNFMTEPPTPQQLASLEWLYQYLKPTHQNMKAIGHKEAIKYVSWATATDCPGTNFPLAVEEAKMG